MRVLFFGDSITQGFYDSEGGWAQRLANHYHGKSLKGMLNVPGFDTIEVFNLGVSGDTSQNILKRIANESRARTWPKDKLLIVIAVGVNDSRLHKNNAILDVYEFQTIYEKIIDESRTLGDKILCVGLSAVDEAKTSPWQYSSHKYTFLNNRINLFEDTVKQSALRKGVPFIGIHDIFLAKLKAGRNLLSDGLHPNDAGHELIANLVRPHVDDLIG